MRKAVTFLQSVARFRSNMTITEADVHEITGVSESSQRERHVQMLSSGNVKVIPDSVIENLYQVCHAGSYEKLATTVKVEQRDRTRV